VVKLKVKGKLDWHRQGL